MVWIDQLMEHLISKLCYVYYVCNILMQKDKI